MAQGIGLFAGEPVLGIDFPLSRGVSPSTGLMRILPVPVYDRIIGNLSLSYNGVTVSMSDAAVVAVAQENFDGRDAFRWNVEIQDRRWRWRYPRISGTYNRRLCDGTIDPKGKKSAQELVALIAAELADTIDASQLPDAYPPIVWEGAMARFELAWLCDLFGFVVCPKINNTFALEPITATTSLPPGGSFITPWNVGYSPSVMPSDLRVQGAQDRKQGWVPLQAIELGPDGKWKLLTSLGQWPHTFPDVSQADRHLAFQTAFRFYAPVDPTIILEDHALETGLDVPADRKRCLPPQLRGAFFCHDDFGTTTPAAAIYNGEFRIRKDLNAVELEYPAYKVLGGVAPADLQVNTGYYVVDSDGNPVSSFQKDKPIPKSVLTTKPRVLRHGEMGKREIVAALYGTAAGDNMTQLNAEADLYLNSVAGSYEYTFARDVIYNGLFFPDTTEGISQIHWLCGNDRIATTKISLNSEADVTSATHHQRRAQERLSQMAERMGI